MGGQMQQSNAAAATALYDHATGAAAGPLHNAGPTGDAGDAVMARWLQSAGLQHLASPASTGIDNRLLPNLLMQGYGAQSAEEKQRLFKLMRNLNFNGESGSEPYTPTAQSLGGAASDGLYSPELRGDFGAGLLDLHAMDDTELLSEHVISEPFEPSPFMPGGKEFEDELNLTSNRQQRVLPDPDPSFPLAQSEKESTKENNVAKIKVVVRKRPLNKKELSRKEEDIVTVYDNAYLTVHEPKLKVDLTAYVEKHEFCFDAVLNEQVSNDEVYRATVEPIIPIIFERTKATCFAYGQTGSGKTFTMQPLPIRAAEDLVRLLHQPVYRNQRFKLWLSYFEIYGGKLFDLLSDRKKLCMREDGRQQVCIVGLQEFEVSDVQIVKEFIERGNASRSTGSTGANEESSRSHAILQLVVKKHTEVKDSRRNIDVNESRSGKVVGKISFIDLAGSERGADTTDNDRQTRIEGAEINKSLLALKECIRALDNDQIHIPFRGSKLTEVLRDSFVGNSRTVMISCISPNAGSCEHTLNTLRYADRVKSLSKGGNARKDQAINSLPPANRDVSLASSTLVSSEVEDVREQHQEVKVADTGRRAVEKESFSYIPPTPEFDKQPAKSSSSNPINVRPNTPSNIDPWAIIGNESSLIVSTDRSSCFDRNKVALRMEVLCDSEGANSCPAGGVGIYNPGFWGMNIEKGKTYSVVLHVRSSGSINVSLSLTGSDGLQKLAAANIIASGSEVSNWTKFQIQMEAQGTNPNSRLQLTTNSKGVIWFDQVSAIPLDTHKGHGFRKDLVQMLADLKPRFFRFPGGCFVEGEWLRNAFRWKETIGPWEERPGHFGDVWMYWTDDGLGYFEFLQLSEDLGALPIWVFNNGISHNDQVDTSNVLPFVQEALDGIEFARGSPNSTWGSLRVKMGHPEPFDLRYVAIGNEDCKKTNYLGNYLKFYSAIRKAYPDIKMISNCDGSSQKLDHPADMYDFHIYTSSSDLFSMANHFDHTSRDGPKAFVSEYAVTGKDAGTGSLLAALAEAGFLIGLEKNSDVVEMASYAPLFVNTHDRRWNPDAIVFDSSQLYGTPSYWVQCLFNESSGATIYNTTLQTNSSTSLLASAISWKNSKNKNTYLRIKVVNLGTNTVNLKVSVNGLEPNSISPSGSTKTVLTSNNLMDENSFKEPKKVIPKQSLLESAGEEMEVVISPQSFTSIDLLLESLFVSSM